MSAGRIVSDNHALITGQVLGALMRAEAEGLLHDAHGPAVEAVDDGRGNYSDTIRVRRPSGSYLVTVRPE